MRDNNICHVNLRDYIIKPSFFEWFINLFKRIYRKICNIISDWQYENEQNRIKQEFLKAQTLGEVYDAALKYPLIGLPIVARAMIDIEECSRITKSTLLARERYNNLPTVRKIHRLTTRRKVC